MPPPPYRYDPSGFGPVPTGPLPGTQVVQEVFNILVGGNQNLQPPAPSLAPTATDLITWFANLNLPLTAEPIPPMWMVDP